MATKSLIGTYNKKGQKIVDPDYLFYDAPRERHFMTGSEVVREAIKRANVDVSISYPITPQSEAAAMVGDLWVEGYVGEYFRGENEFAVMSECAGASFGGARVFTTTSGPGTLRAYENFPMWVGSRLPIMLNMMVRGVNSPLSIQPDTLEIGLIIDTGMLIWHAESAQDFFDYLLMGYMVAEEPDVHLPIAICIDGFFVSHTKDDVYIPSVDFTLPPYDPYRNPMPVMDMEVPPVRMMRDPFVMKSNYISYATQASWQQETRAACERSRKHTIRLLGGLIEEENTDAEILIVSSGTAVAQGREAVRLLAAEGIKVGIVKIKTIRPFPYEEVRQATKNAKIIFVPEFNVVGWMAREIKASIPDNHRVVEGPHVAGGMTMPPEVIVEEIKKVLAKKKESIHE
ncbi:Pyruvate:ferredoxin oxidoreductase, alpha subunit [hydrothermal vent metagenome]|uniref:Pyruvate:ferredoxin oxidoreductase, alpha subunit n=1 Tax=hydrothermal vent metagenome TaxID=652676 RepID=A0A3B1D518_9ZZZZ